MVDAQAWAVRIGKWKLLNFKGSLELYDLYADISEKHNLKDQHPQIVERLQRAYAAWKNQMAPPMSKTRRDRTPATTVRQKKARSKR